MSRGAQIAVSGGGGDPRPEDVEAAEEVGRLLAERGATVVCGGLGGIMEAVARGSAGAGGEVIGILPGTDPAEASEHCTRVVATGTGHARNLAVVASADVAIAVGGSWGTLAEIAYARVLGRPVVILEPGWAVDGDGIERAATPAEAVELALAGAR